MIFQKICGLILVAILGGVLAGCNTTDGSVAVVAPDGSIVRKIPIDVAELPDRSLSVFVRNQDQGLTVADSAVGMYHCTPQCRPAGGGMVGSSGASPIISAGLGAIGSIGFGALGSNGGGGNSSVAFNNNVQASVKSTIRNSGGNNAGIGNSRASVDRSGNSFNDIQNGAVAGANAQNLNR